MARPEITTPDGVKITRLEATFCDPVTKAQMHPWLYIPGKASDDGIYRCQRCGYEVGKRNLKALTD